jgi:hypothetical protein
VCINNDFNLTKKNIVDEYDDDYLRPYFM